MPQTTAKLPAFIARQLPVLSAEPPTGIGWIHKVKHGGFRTLLRLDRGQAQAFTPCLSVSPPPELLMRVRHLPVDYPPVLVGPIVALESIWMLTIGLMSQVNVLNSIVRKRYAVLYFAHA
jgi:hypothetical protein